MNRSELSDLCRKAQEQANDEERRSMQVLAVFIGILLAAMVGISLANWMDQSAAQLMSQCR